MRDALSRKLQAVRFVLMFFVVLIHTDPARIVLREDFESIDLQPHYSHVMLTAVCPGTTGVAVPMFFTISGFLFFYGFEGNGRQFLGKWKRRFWSLVVPYVLWSAIYLLAVCLWQSTALSSLDQSIHVSYRADELLNRLFLKPFAQQLWFVRDLILLGLLSPVVWCLVRRCGAAPSLVMGGLWLLGLCPGWNRQVISLTGPLFFTTGAYLASHKIDVEVPISGRRVLGLAWLGYLIAAAYLMTQGQDAYALTRRIAILLGIPALWYNYDLLRPLLESSAVRWMSPLFFFVYAGQNLTAPLVEKGLGAVWPFCEWSLLLALLVGATLLAAMWIGLAAATRQLFPLAYDLLSGGRGSPYRADPRESARAKRAEAAATALEAMGSPVRSTSVGS